MRFIKTVNIRGNMEYLTTILILLAIFIVGLFILAVVGALLSIILGLVFSSGLIAENINQNVETDENPGIQPQEFPIPEELIGFETQTYGNLDADEFFWVENIAGCT